MDKLTFDLDEEIASLNIEWEPELKTDDEMRRKASDSEYCMTVLETFLRLFPQIYISLQLTIISPRGHEERKFAQKKLKMFERIVTDMPMDKILHYADIRVTNAICNKIQRKKYLEKLKNE